MYHKAAPGETKKRDLHQDDLNGFFAILGVTEMKKRIITILNLALTVLLTLGACSSVEKNTDNANDKAVLDKNTAAGVNKPENENIPTDNHIPDVSENKPEENTAGNTNKKSDSTENNEQKNLPTDKVQNNAAE